MSKISYLLLACFLIPSYLPSMEKYDVETKNEQITCKIQPFTMHQTRLLLSINNYPTHEERTITESSFSGDKTTHETYTHPVHNLAYSYVAVKVIIENKSDEKIYLSRDSYIKKVSQNIQPLEAEQPIADEQAPADEQPVAEIQLSEDEDNDPFFIPKKKILKSYPDHEESKNISLSTAIVPIVIILFSRFTFIPSLDNEVRNSNDPDDWIAYNVVKYFLAAFGGIISLAGFIGYIDENKKLESYNKIAKYALFRQKIVNNQTGKTTRHFTKIFSPEQHYFYIPPNSSFIDVLFIPIQKYMDKEIEKTNFELIYSDHVPEKIEEEEEEEEDDDDNDDDWDDDGEYFEEEEEW